MLLILKLVMTPFFIGSVTLAGRRWGPVVSGLLIGLPLTSGPISLILTLQDGPDFAARAAAGSIAGQISVCIFCLSYSLISQRMSWTVTGILAASVYLATIAVWNTLALSSMLAFVALLVVITLVARLIPQYNHASRAFTPPKWDLPARMITATIFVLLLTTFSSLLGAQLSGLLSPFPVFGLVLSAFAQHQQGPMAAARILRGQVLGSLAFGSFFLAVALLVTVLAPGWTFAAATTVALTASALSFYLARDNSAPMPAGIGA